jgi:hypothetical protein
MKGAVQAPGNQILLVRCVSCIGLAWTRHGRPGVLSRRLASSQSSAREQADPGSLGDHPRCMRWAGESRPSDGGVLPLVGHCPLLRPG